MFRPVVVEKIQKSARAGESHAAAGRLRQGIETRRLASTTLAEAGAADLAGARAAFLAADDQLSAVRARASALARESGEPGYKDFTGDTPTPDVNYVFPTFVTTRLPMGLVGLIIAAIFAAAMSSIAAELNSLATASVIDIYRRRSSRSRRMLTTRACRIATGLCCSPARRDVRGRAGAADRGRTASSLRICSACPCWHWSSAAPTATGLVGLLAGIARWRRCTPPGHERHSPGRIRLCRRGRDCRVGREEAIWARVASRGQGGKVPK